MTVSDIVREWKSESGIKRYDDPTVIHQHEGKLFIITKQPGLFIGYHGNLINKYREVFRNHGYEFEIQFVDTFCGDVKEF